jgi:hypothetical protein
MTYENVVRGGAMLNAYGLMSVEVAEKELKIVVWGTQGRWQSIECKM